MRFLKTFQSAPRMWRLTGRIVIGSSLLLWLLSEAELPKMVEQWKEVDWLFLLSAGLTIHCVAIILDAGRWQIILKERDLDLPLWPLAVIYLKGAFLGTFLPGGIGGDVYRMYALAQLTRHKTEAISSVLVERGMGVLCLLALGLLALCYSHLMLGGTGFETVAAPLFMLSLAFAGVWASMIVLARTKEIARIDRLYPGCKKLRQFLETIPLYFSTKSGTGKVVLLSMCLQLIIVSWSWVVANSLGYALPFGVLLVTMPPILIFTMLPLSINGIGVRETAYVFFLDPFGISATEAITLSLVSYSIFAALRMLSGILFFFDFEKEVRFVSDIQT